jgi:hypothetical protein
MDALQVQWDAQKVASDAAFTADMGSTAAAQQAEVQRVTDLKSDQAAWNAQKASQEANATAAYVVQKGVEDAAFEAGMVAKRDTEIERQANVSAALAAEVQWNTDRDAAVAAQAATHAALKAASDSDFTSNMQVRSRSKGTRQRLLAIPAARSSLVCADPSPSSPGMAVWAKGRTLAAEESMPLQLRVRASRPQSAVCGRHAIDAALCLQWWLRC